MERTAGLDPRDAAAAGANLLDVDHGDLQRQAGGVTADHRAAGHQHVAIVDDAGLGGGAAHVERDGVGEPDAIAQRLGGDDAGGGTGFQHAHAGALRLLDIEQPAGRLHDQEIAREARDAEMVAHLGEITPHPRAHIGIGGGRRGALELAIFLRQLVGRGDEDVRIGLLDDAP